MKTLMMIRKMKEVLTWVWIVVIWCGYLPECVCPDSTRLERTGETTEFLYG